MPTLTLHQTRKREEAIRAFVRLGMTQRQIAEEVGVSQQAVQKFCKLRGIETLTTILRKKKP